MVDVKFCGITRVQDAHVAVELGARYVGCILAESPRRVAHTRAAEISSEALRGGATPIGVFVDADLEQMLRIVDAAGLGGVQLHGTADVEQVARLRARFGGEIWVVTRIGPAGLDGGLRELMDVADGVLLDTLSPAAHGGTGESFDWHSAAAGLSAHRGSASARIIVAGGLRPENVARVITILSPDVVDVSSGVEASPGIKDHERMRAFAAAVRVTARR